MSFLKKENNAFTTVNTSITNSDLSLVVVSAALFPVSGDFLITIWDKITYPDPTDDSNMEIVKVTTVSGNIFFRT